MASKSRHSHGHARCLAIITAYKLFIEPPELKILSDFKEWIPLWIARYINYRQNLLSISTLGLNDIQ